MNQITKMPSATNKPNQHLTVKLSTRSNKRFKNSTENFHSFTTRIVSALLILTILSVSTPEAFPATLNAATGWQQRADFWLRQNNYFIDSYKSLTNFLAGDPKAAQTQISRLEISPSESLSITTGSEINFAAVAFDSADQIVMTNGLSWSVEQIGGMGGRRRMLNGVFKAKRPGTYLISVQKDGLNAEKTVTVTGQPLSLIEKSSKAMPQPIYSTRNGIAASKDTSESDSSQKRQSELSSDDDRSVKISPETNNAPADRRWDDGNIDTIENPGNQTGNPPGGAADDGVSNGNFQLSAPVLTLPGRGAGVSLSLNYNSRLWNKAGNRLTYDLDKGNPAPGWSIGFGKLIYSGTNSGCLMIDADGTRHGYMASGPPRQTYGSTWYENFYAKTTDGTFIDYHCSVSSNGHSLNGIVRLPNGTTITYGSAMASNEQAYPTRIVDANGNYITITYRSNAVGQIDKIFDTAGRIIEFKYDSLNRLTHITAPGLYTTRRTLVRLHYRSFSLGGANFATGTVRTVDDENPYLLNAIYYPATATGYWFGDTDSYSPYGMLAKIVEQRNMNWTAGADVNEQGGFNPSAAQISRELTYRYLPAPAGGYSDAPNYDQLKESWAGMDDAESVTEYTVNNDDTDSLGRPARSVTIKQPNDVYSKQYMFKVPDRNNPAHWKNGLVSEDKTYTVVGSTQTILSRSLVDWGTGLGDYNSPRPARTEKFDERNQKTSTEYVYGAQLNQVIGQKDFGYNDQLLQETRTTFENSGSYLGNWYNGNYVHGRHIFGLVKATEILDENGNRVSRTEYEYDNNHNGSRSTDDLADTPGVDHHLEGYNPTDYSTYATNCRYECPDNDYDPVFWRCNVPEVWVCDYPETYDSSTGFRGNVTKVTDYAAVTSGTLADPQIETRRYDITGNVIASSNGSSQLSTYTYTPLTQYAYRESESHGSANLNSPLRITTKVEYDPGTGLATAAVDANNLRSTTSYNSLTSRPSQITSSTGAYTTFVYNDSVMSTTEETHLANGNIAGQRVIKLNGIGKTVRQEVLGANNVSDIVETKYDRLGREWYQSRPFRTGQTVYWKANEYDALGRVKKTTAPDGSISRSVYNESSRPGSASNLPGLTVRSRDEWGRERWARYDERERLVEIVEPDPNGDGDVLAPDSLVTKYKYNTLNKLIETEQGSQIRRFHYDSLGRLTRQKLAEQTATLDDNGVYVGPSASGANWSSAYFYDGQSNLAHQTDARGVKTYYNYQINGVHDPLNRLQAVNYDLSGPRDTSQPIYAASNVTYEYITSGDLSRIKKVTAVGTSSEEYFYDPQSRISDYTQTLASGSPVLTTSYIYDTLDRVTDVQYPAQFGLQNNSSPRRIVHQDYDQANRLETLKYNNQIHASEFEYDAASQTTKLKVGNGTNQITEEYSFDSPSGLLTRQKVKRANNESLLDLSYAYNRSDSAGVANGITGAVTGIVDNINRNKDRSFQYDALGRLVKASGGVNQTWTQKYQYDRYGNRKSVEVTGVQALRPSEAVANREKINEPATKVSAKGGDPKNYADPNLSSNQIRPTISQDAPPTANQLVAKVNGFINEESPVKPEGNSFDLSDSNNKSQTDSPLPSRSVERNQPSEADNVRKVDGKPTSGAKDSELSPDPSARLLTERVHFNFDDHKNADFGVWRRSSANWIIRNSGDDSINTTQFGSAGNQIAPGDYDGDKKTDLAVWNPTSGLWTIKDSSTGTVRNVQWGAKGDAIVPADYDGDGKTDLAVWRPSTGTWYILQSSNNQNYSFQWGGQQFGDIAMPGDYDGDGRADAVVWRPENGNWHLLILQSSTSQYIGMLWGSAGDVPVPADYDGDGKTDLAVWRPSTGTWYILQSSNNQYVSTTLGVEAVGDIPAPANYDGVGGVDPAVWHPTNGTFDWRRMSDNSTFQINIGAQRGDLPIPAAYIRRSSAPAQQYAESERDGYQAMTYDETNNRINNVGENWQYDAAGNQVRAKTADGTTWVRYEYDAANRLVYIRPDINPNGIIEGFTYGATNQRIMSSTSSGQRTLYATSGSTVLAEYVDYNQAGAWQWAKSYIQMDGQLLSTITPDGTGSEAVEHHHPDRLGTRLITNPQTASFYEQATLPFGTALASETTGATNRRFTSYDRSQTTGLDYAVNRHYDSKQGRFTQVDPIGMQSVSFEAPQTLNLYSYCANDPVNRTDPDGLFFGKLFKFLKSIFKYIAIAIAVAAAILVFVSFPGGIALSFKFVTAAIGAISSAASSILQAVGLPKIAAIFGIVGAALSLTSSIALLKGPLKLVNLAKVIRDGASVASQTLMQFGKMKIAQFLGLVSTVAGFIAGGYRENKGNAVQLLKGKFSFRTNAFDVLKFARSTTQQVASLAGATRLAGILDSFGFIDDVGDLYIGIKNFNQNDPDSRNYREDEDLPKTTQKYIDKGYTPVAAGSQALKDRQRGRLTRLGAQVGTVRRSFSRLDRALGN